MSRMTHRFSAALDDNTRERLNHLAEIWHVSQAEVVRRAVARAAAEAAQMHPDPVAMLRDLHAQGLGVDPRRANAYLSTIRAERKHWRAR